MEILFIMSIGLIAYTYFGFPALLFAFGRLFARPVHKDDLTPGVTVIITAYNEERDIARKIENTLAVDYPRELLEIIVASDCSSDRTDEIVVNYRDRGVRLHRQAERLGKTAAQNSAARISSGEILVFSDATTRLEPDSLRKVVRSFADPEVGCVSGRLVYVDPESGSVGRGCRSYWSYESSLRQCESRLGSLIGVSGCLYAVRRSSYALLAHDMCSDFVIATEVYLQGLRAVYEPEAVSSENTNHRARDEFRMRVRVIEQTMSSIYSYREVLNPWRHGLYAFQMISHKILRYTVPALLLVALASNALLAAESDGYRVAFIGQASFYFSALAGLLADRAGLRVGALTIPYYFALTNAASLIAFIKFMRGEAHVVWEPSRETGSPV